MIQSMHSSVTGDFLILPTTLTLFNASWNRNSYIIKARVNAVKWSCFKCIQNGYVSYLYGFNSFEGDKRSFAINNFNATIWGSFQCDVNWTDQIIIKCIPVIIDTLVTQWHFSFNYLFLCQQYFIFPCFKDLHLNSYQFATRY